MKTNIKPLLLALAIIGSVAMAHVSMAQAPAPPPPSGAKGGNGNKAPGGGGAPVDGGLIVSLALIAGFGGWKFYKGLQLKKQDNPG